MSTKKPRLWEPKPHRAVNYNERAIERIIERDGYIYAEPKYDGIRCLLVYLKERWVATTREGIEIPALADVLSYMRVKLDGYKTLVLDTEVFIDGLSFEESTGLLRRDAHLDLEHAKNVRFALLDVVTRYLGDAQMFSADPMRRRLAQHADCLQGLNEQFIDPGCLRVRCNSLEEVDAAYNRYRELGYEGAVIKDANLEYRNGKVSGWFKRKPDITVGGVVVGFRYGDTGKANEGLVVGFQVALEDGTNCVATGFSQALMHEVTDNPEGYYGRAVEVSAMERTAGGKLRHPSFKRFRDMEGSEGVEA